MQTITKWQIWWASLVACAGFVCAAMNTKRYPDKSFPWILGKTLLDLSVVFTLCLVPALTPLMIAFIVMWSIHRMKLNGVYATVVGFFTGLLLSTLAGRILEIVFFLGVWSVEVFTGRLLRNWKEYAT